MQSGTVRVVVLVLEFLLQLLLLRRRLPRVFWSGRRVDIDLRIHLWRISRIARFETGINRYTLCTDAT
ncbi:hypothetical protein A5696_24840 [Mycobacterium sp. E2699]|nr:hypothetical protein A5696_24840 [Mycobacterium sp. E2699]OBI50840.1 hypothetical protein A5705_10465 [Mycobacterium sp. E787]